MKGILTERNLVAALFVMVFISFLFARNETKKMEELFLVGNTTAGKMMEQVLKGENAPAITIQASPSSPNN